MCGVVAIEGQTQDGFLNTVLDRIKHRGPDDRGRFVSDCVALGHTRLSIIDVAGGKQPIFNEQGDVGIVLNGEIYNFRELRKELETRHTFRTSTDTEVILHLYEERGPECVHSLAGMFAFAIADRGKLFVARDRIGIKPLYSGVVDGKTMFASELKCMKGCTDVREFPPGSLYTSAGGYRSYYTLPESQQEEITEEEAIGDVQEILRQAVERRLVADVPVGVFLSGGLDSSIIAALMREHVAELHSFAVGVEGSPDLAAAREVAIHLGTRHHELMFSETDMLAVLPEVIYYLESFDAPLVRSAVPGFFVSRLAQEQVKVILTGEGADELFGGYHYLRTFEAHSDLSKELSRITANLHNSNLQRTDRMTMAHSVEARVPFLDPDVVAFAFRLPMHLRMPSPERMEKWLLRQAFADLIPPAIAWRKKQKFSEGAGSSDIMHQVAEERVSDSDYHEMPERIAAQLRSKEELMFYRIFREYFDGLPADNVIGRTADYPTG